MPSPPHTPIRVLIVEDSAVNQRLLTCLLDMRNCTVTLVTDGQQAVQKMETEEFDVVLMDVQMPVMDGLEATRLIRQQETGSNKRTPIVGVTAGIDREQCLSAGMDDYMPKPIQAKLLDEKLDAVLGNFGNV